MNIHIPIRPLRLLNDIQAGVDDELVHVPRRVREAESRNAVPAGLGRAEGEAEEGDVRGREDRKVVGHGETLLIAIILREACCASESRDAGAKSTPYLRSLSSDARDSDKRIGDISATASPLSNTAKFYHEIRVAYLSYH